MNIYPTNEVATFWFSFNGPQEVSFEDFVKKNNVVLQKISKFRYEDWSSKIEEGFSLLDVLIRLNMLHHIPYKFQNSGAIRSRIRALYRWEARYGLLPSNLRSSFIRHSIFEILKSFDIEILLELIDEHKKLDSISSHLSRLLPRTDDDEFASEFEELFQNLVSEDLIQISYVDEISTGNFVSENELNSLAIDLNVSLEWNLDEMSSEDILGFYDEYENHPNLF
jgi:hypothetical protein